MRLAVRRRAATVLGTAALVGLTACGPKKDPVQALVDGLEAAVDARDADAVRDRVSEDFRGQGGINRAEALSMLRRYFAAYEKVDAEVYDLEVQRADGAADVTFRAEFSGKGLSFGGLDGLLPPGAAYRFQLHVVDQGGTWRVQRAAWEDVAPPAAQER
jgi:hypothetical protein